MTERPILADMHTIAEIEQIGPLWEPINAEEIRRERRLQRRLIAAVALLFGAFLAAQFWNLGGWS